MKTRGPGSEDPPSQRACSSEWQGGLPCTPCAPDSSRRARVPGTPCHMHQGAGPDLLCPQLTRPLCWRPGPQGSLCSRDSYSVSAALPSCAILHVTLASTGELRLRARERPRPRGCTVGTPPGMRRGPGLLSPGGGRAHRHPKGVSPDPAPPGLPTAGALAEVGAGGACRAAEGQPQGLGPALRPGCGPA